LTYYPISQCYLSDAYGSDHAVESLVKQLDLPETRFISGHLLSEFRTADKWRKIFKKLGVKIDLQQVVIEIIENLQDIPVENHFQCCKEIFKFWSDNKDKETQLTKEQLEKIANNLRLLTDRDEYYLDGDCYISDHYLNSNIQSTIIPSLNLTVISEKYEPNRSKTIDWKDFFIEIGFDPLDDKRDVFISKWLHINENQDSHFNILEEVSALYDNPDNAYLFDHLYISPRLLTDKNGWVLPAKTHFSTVYKPALDLQSDERVNENISFLNKQYDPQKISRKFLKFLGVQDNFSISSSDKPILIKDLKDQEYARGIGFNSGFKAEKNRLQLNWRYPYPIEDRMFLKGFVDLNYSGILQFEDYFDQFISFLSKNKKASELLIQDSQVCFFNNPGYKVDNYILYSIQKYKLFLSEGGERNYVEDLVSKKLSKWVLDKNYVPKTDLTDITIGEDKVTLEEIIGVQQNLDPESILGLLKLKQPLLTLNDFEELEIVDLMEDLKLNEEDLDNCHLYDKEGKWKPINTLFYNEDNLDISPNNIIHNDLEELVSSFRIKSLNVDDLELRIIPSETDPSNEIIEFFEERGKFIAYAIESSSMYSSVLDEILIELKKFDFFQVESIELFLPFDGISYSEPKEFYVDVDDSVYFTDDWRSNKELRVWIVKSILKEKISLTFFKNALFHSEAQLVTHFKMNNDDADEILIPNKASETSSSRDDNFLKEVNDFIENELEGTEWREHITDLRMMLEFENNIGERNQKIYNLLAKLKLAKKRNIRFDSVKEEDRKFNLLEGNGEKYIVHSARSSFAYIAPIEILKMKKEGYKMALDFGSKKEIKIYDKAEDLLNLNTNHLLLYQHRKSIDQLFDFCEKNKDANKRLLIIDKNNASDKVKELLQFINADEDF
jgi:hypothetical protein